MIYQGNHITTTFTPKNFARAQAAWQKTGRTQYEQVSLYRYNAALSDVKIKLQGSETIQVITEWDSSVTAAFVILVLFEFAQSYHLLIC